MGTHTNHQKSHPLYSAHDISRREMLSLLGGVSGMFVASHLLSRAFSGHIINTQHTDRELSHGNDVAPDYSIIFPQDRVNNVLITITPENWQVVQDDLTSLLGTFGSGVNNRGSRPDGNFPGGGQPPEGFQQPGDVQQVTSTQQPPTGFQDSGDGSQQMPGRFQPPANDDQFFGSQPQDRFQGPGGGGNLDFTESDPIWVPVTVTLNDELTWDYVGFRYKGNSTLSGAWSNGSLKIGFKLNFDKFEDDYPEIDNQRFFGFDELSFSSNFRDASYLHEKVAADIFRNAGIPSAHSAFYAVYMDYGEGRMYIGVYTALEEIDDTVIETQFNDDSGNLYKPEGSGATFAAGTFDEVSFEKKTNEDEADFSDIIALFDALHATTRTTDPTAWRNGLQSVFNVDEFLQWLAVNTLIQNWDTYGTMSHNFYLYNDPSTGLLTWIPWDNNEALSSSGGLRNNNGSLDLSNNGDNWPLISYLLNDSVYFERYVASINEVMYTAFEPAQMTITYQTLHDLITPYVTGDATGSPDLEFTSAGAFQRTVDELINHVNQRYTLALDYVSNHQ